MDYIKENPGLHADNSIAMRVSGVMVMFLILWCGYPFIAIVTQLLLKGERTSICTI
jgi:hypothetical protein